MLRKWAETNLYCFEMLTCVSIRYDLKSVYYTCDTVILLGSNCVWLVYDLKLSVYYTVIGWVDLATLFLTSSVRGQLMTVVRVKPGRVPCMTWKSEPLVVEFIRRAIYKCESHSLSDSPVSMKKWIGEPDDWQENLFISSPLLQVGGGSDSFSHCPAWGWVSRPHCPHSRGTVGESVKWLHIFFTDNCDSASFLVQENLPGRLDLD